MNASVRAAAALAAVGVLLFALERVVPLRRSRVALLRRLFVNAAISALAFTAALGTVGPTVSTTMEWTSHARLGLLRLYALPPAAGLVATFLLMDLLFYYWHLLNHAVPLLWRFHNVHHIDPDLDVTTAFRFAQSPWIRHRQVPSSTLGADSGSKAAAGTLQPCFRAAT